jgi:methylated-DNA-[protein]-cysteine S-methyltransferase
METSINTASRWQGTLSQSPLGPITVMVSEGGLAGINFGLLPPLKLQPAGSSNTLTKALEQIQEYLDGHRQQFDLPIDWASLEPFQRSVLEKTYAIPYGQTRTYGQVTLSIGKPLSAARAVGGALAHNPMPLVLPCHRVIGTDGRLHGYGGPGGIKTKAWLLEMEGVLLVKTGLV